jgi:hypothetical protein
MAAGGYTRSRTWRVTTRDGAFFVKEAEDEGSLHMLRREALVYREVSGSFLPSFVGFADSDEKALLAVEFLDDAYWPPPYPDDVCSLFASVEQIAATEPPAELPRHQPPASQWAAVAADPDPFLSLGLCSRQWLEESLRSLMAAESSADFQGDALVHNDLYSGNVCFTPGGVVLVDWGAAIRGSASIDLAFALLSVRVEGAKVPVLDFPDEAAFAASLSGLFAVGALAPLPDWAEPGSTLREDMAADLAHALHWAVERLELSPLMSL